MYELTKEHNEQINRDFLCFPRDGKTLTLNMLHIGIHQRFNLNFFWSNLSLFSAYSKTLKKTSFRSVALDYLYINFLYTCSP